MYKFFLFFKLNSSVLLGLFGDVDALVWFDDSSSVFMKLIFEIE